MSFTPKWYDLLTKGLDPQGLHLHNVLWSTLFSGHAGSTVFWYKTAASSA